MLHYEGCRVHSRFAMRVDTGNQGFTNGVAMGNQGTIRVAVGNQGFL